MAHKRHHDRIRQDRVWFFEVVTDLPDVVCDLGSLEALECPDVIARCPLDASNASDLRCLSDERENGQLRALNRRERVKPKKVMFAHTHSRRNSLRWVWNTCRLWIPRRLLR